MPTDSTIIVPAKRHILVVEDENSVREVITEILSEGGSEVTAYASAGAFLNGIAVVGKRPNALILDVRLGPGMDGFALAARVREIWPELPIVFVSGDLRTLVRFSGHNDLCLMKPFTAEVLLRILQDL